MRQRRDDGRRRPSLQSLCRKIVQPQWSHRQSLHLLHRQRQNHHSLRHLSHHHAASSAHAAVWMLAVPRALSSLPSSRDAEAMQSLSRPSRHRRRARLNKLHLHLPSLLNRHRPFPSRNLKRRSRRHYRHHCRRRRRTNPLQSAAAKRRHRPPGWRRPQRWPQRWQRRSRGRRQRRPRGKRHASATIRHA